MNLDDILDIDHKHIWHPYAAMPNLLPVYPVDSAKGVILTLKDGRQLIDGMSSWWSTIHGYNHPALNSAVINQLDKMAHVMFGGLTHEPAAKLAKTLVEITPQPLTTVFFSDSGSVAVEVAIKMALQYWIGKGRSEKNRLLALKGGYHGDTFTAMSTCDPVTGMHHLFQETLIPQYFAERPTCRFDASWNEQDMDSLRQQLEWNQHELAAVILEPIVQGAGGMWFYSPQYLKRVRELCDEYDVLLILDEIATGFGRTGELFGCQHAGISADIMCLGKALTGGYLTLAATLCTEEIARHICASDAGTFMHGPTFMANPLACAVANASIDLLLSADWKTNIHRIESQLARGLEPARKFSHVADVRILGAIGVIEMKNAVDMQKLQPLFVECGVWLRPFGNLVYTMPPYIISDEELSRLCHGMLNAISN